MEQEAIREKSDERPAIDPYDDVALGVECAWPGTIAFEDDDSPGARQSASHP
jgi:hypothetical protein